MTDQEQPNSSEPAFLNITFAGEGSAHFTTTRSAGVSPWMLAAAAEHLRLWAELEMAAAIGAQIAAEAQKEAAKHIAVAGSKLPRKMR